MTRSTAATIIALGVTALAAVLSWPAYRFAQAARPVAPAQPTAPVTATLAISPTETTTATRTPVATDTATPTLTPTPPWVSIRTDGPMRVQLCTGLAEEHPTPGVLPPLTGCIDVAPWGGAPAVSAPGQWYALWPGQFVYRIIPGPTPWPGWCEPLIVTATPLPTDTATPTPTADWVATAVAGTLTALAPTATDTPRQTDTRPPPPPPEATPTPQRYSLMLFPLLQHRPPTARPR